MDKSGEYYLKNIQLQNRKTDPQSKKVNSLNNPQNLENIPLCKDFESNKLVLFLFILILFI